MRFAVRMTRPRDDDEDSLFPYFGPVNPPAPSTGRTPSQPAHRRGDAPSVVSTSQCSRASSRATAVVSNRSGGRRRTRDGLRTSQTGEDAMDEGRRSATPSPPPPPPRHPQRTHRRNGGASSHYRLTTTLLSVAMCALFAARFASVPEGLGLDFSSSSLPAGAAYDAGAAFRRLESASAEEARNERRASADGAVPQGCVKRAEPKDVRPVIAASYPGSGAKLTWKLLRGMTGIMTGDDHDHNGLVRKRQVVSIKTHYPAIDSEGAEKVYESVNDVSRAMVILRHPMSSIPSYHNFEYEQRNGLPNHSTKAPVEEWEKWRDERFKKEMKAWIDLVRFWVDRVKYEHRIIVQFEKLTSKEEGIAVEEMRRIGEFLHEGDGRVEIVEDLECVHETITSDVRVGFEGERRHSLRKGPDIKYPFTPTQLGRMDQALKELAEWRPGQLGPFMDEYRKMIVGERVHPSVGGVPARADGDEDEGLAMARERLLAAKAGAHLLAPPETAVKELEGKERRV